jgi:hypothetical protein
MAREGDEYRAVDFEDALLPENGPIKTISYQRKMGGF